MSVATSSTEPKWGVARVRWRRWTPLIALAIVNLATFLPHYLGRMTFPWDFVAGYHAHSFGWYGAGSILSPPAWLPWSDMGFPAFLAIQSGAWYLPLAVIDSLGLGYSLPVATALQCLHVLAGAVGAYFLFRRYGFCGWISFLGALAYHFTAAFFSGQQFVDIVRAAAFLPWLWLVFHPGVLGRSRVAPWLAAVLLWQFLVAAYPGNIVSTAYGSAVVCLVSLLAMKSRQERIRYLLLLGSVVASAVLMAMIKWYPVVAQRSQLEYEAANQAILHWKLLATLLLPFNADVFPGDLSMRSLWLPLSLLLGAMFAKIRTDAERLGAGLVVLTLFMAAIVPQVAVLQAIVPGANVSRFLLSDWRPLFQLGLILLSLAGWTRLLRSQYGRVAIVVRTSALVLISLFVIGGMHQIGYPLTLLRTPLMSVLTTALLGVAAVILVGRGRAPGAGKQRAAVALLCLMAGGEAAVYQFSQPVPWRAQWSQTTEILAYSDTLEALGREGATPDTGRRPARYALGRTPAEALQHRRSLAYNRCWYARTYCVLGYNNLKMSAPHQRFASALTASGGDELFAFARRPQQILLLPLADGGQVRGLTPDNIQSHAIGALADRASVEFVEYSPGKVVYRIQIPESALVVENELWWSGWTVRYCNQSGCSAPRPADRTPQELRSWPLEKGTWQVVLEYGNVDLRVGYLLFLAGLLLSVLLPWGVWRLVRPGDRVRGQRA